MVKLIHIDPNSFGRLATKTNSNGDTLDKTFRQLLFYFLKSGVRFKWLWLCGCWIYKNGAADPEDIWLVKTNDNGDIV